MAKKIVSHLPPRHMDDTLAILYLKARYPEAEIEFVHPQQDEEKLKEYREDPEVILVDVGGDYEPAKGNFDHHQDLNLPSSIKLVLQGKEENLSENAKRFIQIVDEIDRKGFPNVSGKYNLPRDVVIADLQRAFLELAGNPKVIEKMVDPQKGEEQFFEFIEQNTEPLRVPVKVRLTDLEGEYTAYYNPATDEIEAENRDVAELLNRVKEKIRENSFKGIETVVEADRFGIEVKTKEGQVYNPILSALGSVKPESLQNVYTSFFVKATSVYGGAMAIPKEELENKAKQIKEEIERKKRILESVIFARLGNRKVLIDLSDTPLRAGEYFGKYPEAEILIQRNTMNPNQTSIVKNTNNSKTANLNLKDFYEIFGADKEVFTHKAGFITVIDLPIEKVVGTLAEKKLFQGIGQDKEAVWGEDKKIEEPKPF